MQNIPSTLAGKAGEFHKNRCCGHRRSSSLPVAQINDVQHANDKEKIEEDSQPNEGNISVDLSGLVDTFNQISESLCRPSKALVKLLERTDQNSSELNENDDSFVNNQIQNALKQLNTVQGNLHHVLPHMQQILTDYKTIKERTQSRDEMLKTLDKALRRSETRNQSLRGELQDLRDENKCLTEKARQNESILRYLNKGKEEPVGALGMVGDKRKKEGPIRLKRNNVSGNFLTKKSQSVGNMVGLETSEMGENVVDSPEIQPGVSDLGLKFDHCQKVLRDNEKQLVEVIALNKELVLKINDKEAEIMRLNTELFRHQETLSVYEKGFTHLTKGNSEMDAILREEKVKNIKLSERLEDSEGYINCITDKIASYEVELKYLRQQLKKQGDTMM